MSRHNANHAPAHDDPVRRSAYEHAMSILRGRRSLAEAMSEEDRQRLREYDGPEVAGRADRIRRP